MTVEPVETTAIERYDPEKIALIKRTIAKGASDDELALFVEVCERTGLNPFARQVYAIKRWDSTLGREVMGIQVSIDGARLVAQRSGRYVGQTPIEWCGDDKVWTDVWLEPNPPRAARAGVYMVGAPEPIWAVATWDAYCQRKADGSPTRMWSPVGFGPHMLGKCAEMLALRKAFPMELSGLYSAEEMAQSEESRSPAAPGRRPQQSAGGRRRRPPAQREPPADTTPDELTDEDRGTLRTAIDALQSPARHRVKDAWMRTGLPPLQALRTREQWAQAADLVIEAGGTIEDHTRDPGPSEGDVIEAEAVEEDEDDVYVAEQGFVNRHTGEIHEGGEPFTDDPA